MKNIMKSTIKKLAVVCLLILVTVTMIACGKGSNTDRENSAGICKISIDCKTILDNMEILSEEKQGLIPENGEILSEVEIEFFQNENVFDILQRACKQNKILMESSKTVGTGDVYIEGIANLYEFDCGSLSGWQYSVNGEYMSEGCSNYKVQDGDVICWRYTCDMGEDLK